MDSGRPDSDSSIPIRILTAADERRLAQIDQHLTGRWRLEWYRRRLGRALAESEVNVSLGAEIDGSLVGAVLCTVQYGEFGVAEPVAVLDTVIVDRGFQKQGVGAALLDQLEKNLAGLRVERVRTELDWTEMPLMAFLAHAGFEPAPRLVLERRVASAL